MENLITLCSLPLLCEEEHHDVEVGTCCYAPFIGGGLRHREPGPTVAFGCLSLHRIRDNELHQVVEGSGVK